MVPRLIMFDLDNTLAESKQAITSKMALVLDELLSHTKVSVISGGMLSQLVTQVVSHLPPSEHLENLYLQPTSGAALFTYEHGEWMPQYQELLTAEESAEIEKAVREGASSIGFIDFSHEQYGAYIENRGSQVSLSALGQHAPVEEKQAWDPTHEKRKALQEAIAPLLPTFNVKVGGLTTIDITKQGISKAFGVRKLSEHTDIPLSDMLYVGDELMNGGNDEVVKETGIPTRAVKNPQETLHLIHDILSS